MLFARRRQAETLPVGVHLGADALRLIQLRVSRGGTDRTSSTPLLSVVACHLRPLADASDRLAIAAPLIRRALRDGRFIGRDVVTALPPAAVHLRTFRLGAMPAAQLQATLRQHAREGAPLGAADALHVDALPVGQVRQGREAREEYLSVAAREADVRELLDTIGRGVLVRSLQAEPYALYRSVAGRAVCADDGATHVLVHVGDSETLVLIGVGAQLRVVRRVSAGAEHFDLAVARKLDVAPAEARRLRRRTHGTPSRSARDADPVRSVVTDAVRPIMEDVAREAALCVRYHSVSFRAAPPRSVRLLGVDAEGGQLRALLAAATGLPVDTRGVFDGLGGAPGEDDDGGWAVALGLALAYAPAAPAARQDVGKGVQPGALVAAGEVARA